MWCHFQDLVTVAGSLLTASVVLGIKPRDLCKRFYQLNYIPNPRREPSIKRKKFCCKLSGFRWGTIEPWEVGKLPLSTCSEAKKTSTGSGVDQGVEPVVRLSFWMSMVRNFTNLYPVPLQELGADGWTQTNVVTQNSTPTEFGVCHVSLLLTPATLGSFNCPDQSLN